MKERFYTLLFNIGIKGKPCWLCGFSRAAHYKPELEFDVDNYPCEGFTKMEEKR